MFINFKIKTFNLFTFRKFEIEFYFKGWFQSFHQGYL